MTHICITGSEETPKSLEERLAHVLNSNPRLLCELRLDYLDLSPGAAFAFLTKLPIEWAPRLILTQRLRASGKIGNGQCSWDVNTWQSWWKNVMALRTWFAVDLDWLVLDRLAGETLDWRHRFRSRHAFFSVHATLDEIEAYLPELEASAKHHNAGIKVAAPVHGARDLARFAHLTNNLGAHPLRTAVAMGAAGKAWRWSRLAGSVSYFAYSTDSRTALGQDLFQNVLPYVSNRHIPDLYLLWSDDPQNGFGESRWNRVFAKRGWNARYVNIACSDSPGVDATLEEKKIWAHCALEWMELAGVKGASITKPMKELFPYGLKPDETRHENAVNTLNFSGGWSATNTDGPAVLELLREEGVAGEPVVILGGGGAAQGVLATLKNAGHPAEIVRRDSLGNLPRLPEGKTLLSTWPAQTQEALVAELAKQDISPSLVIDAQFQREEKNSPLAAWTISRGAKYIHGIRWWRQQARGQDEFWFTERRAESVRERLEPLMPASKSETLRALAIAALRPGRTEILNPLRCEDTEFFLSALEALGLDCETGNSWVIRGGKPLRSSGEPIFLGEGAAPLRFLGALSLVVEGEKLVLDAAPGLRRRPMGDLFSSLSLPDDGRWPLSLPCGRSFFPDRVCVNRSSQFASGFLMAAAGLLWKAAGKDGAEKRREIRLDGDLKSAPYLSLTLGMLREAGLGHEMQGDKISLFLERQPEPDFQITLDKDASAFSYFELLSAWENLGSLMANQPRHRADGAQADWRFQEMLSELRRKESLQLSLKDTPDLAPTLFAAAIFYRRELRIWETPQLHEKECDRASALVEAAQRLGLPAENLPDGFSVDARKFLPPRAPVQLETKGDHRLAMAFALLGTRFPEIGLDRPESVTKSFPGFWRALRAFQDLLP